MENAAKEKGEKARREKEIPDKERQEKLQKESLTAQDKDSEAVNQSLITNSTSDGNAQVSSSVIVDPLNPLAVPKSNKSKRSAVGLGKAEGSAISRGNSS